MSESPANSICRRCRNGIIWLIGSYVASLAAFWIPIQFNIALSQEVQPHPWIAESPPVISRLIDLGHVKIVLDDPAVREARRTALTLFRFKTEYELRYGIRILSRDGEGIRKAKISGRFLKPTLLIEHEIKLSSTFQPAKPWESRLLLHEMDHVAISTDPRLFKILKSLQHSPMSVELNLPTDSATDVDTIKAAFEKQLDLRRQEVQKVVQEYYRRLDEQSKNGLADLDKRREFFLTLYTKPDLESLEFPYLNEIQEILPKASTLDIEKHYRLSTQF